MSMGIVNNNEFDLEKSNLKILEESNLVPSTQIIDITKGRGIGNVEVPDSLRKIIGETSTIEGRSEAIALAKQFGISSSSTSAYANGSHSTSSYDNPTEVKQHINNAKERITKKARNKLILALNHITTDKLENAGPAVLSQVARNMGCIIKDMEPDSDKVTGSNQPQFIFYAPQIKSEASFDVIYSKE
jgi:hypothetical protein